MGVTSRSDGHLIEFVDGAWRFKGTHEPVEPRTCRHCGKAPLLVAIVDGYGNHSEALIDYCIADIVRSLNAGGMRTIASCCGHGRELGSIILADGRELCIAVRT